MRAARCAEEIYLVDVCSMLVCLCRRNKYIEHVTSVRAWHQRVLDHMIAEGGGREDEEPSTLAKLGEIILISR